MEFDELIIKRRSVRDYRDERVPQDLVMEIIKEACLAPSSSNSQPWRFIVISDRELMKRISDESKANILASIRADPDSPSKNYEGLLANKKYNVFYNAPCLVIIAGPRRQKSVFVDCALAAGYFMLSAASRGLGTCWVNLGSDIRDPGLLEEIGLPKDCVIVAPVILGYPAKIPGIPPRNEPLIFKYVG